MKQGRLLVVLPLIASVAINNAVAQVPPGAGIRLGFPLGVAGSLFFTAVVDESRDDATSAINKIREATGADDVKAHTALAYMTEAIDRMNKLAPGIIASTCARRSELVTIPQLAQALAQEDAAYEEGRAQIVRGLVAALGTEGLANLEKWLNQKHRDKLYVPNDYTISLSRKGITAAEYLTTRCDHLVAPGGPRSNSPA